MPLYLCHNCAHEIQSISINEVICDWCGEMCIKLNEKEPLDQMREEANIFIDWLLEFTKNRKRNQNTEDHEALQNGVVSW